MNCSERILPIPKNFGENQALNQFYPVVITSLLNKLSKCYQMKLIQFHITITEDFKTLSNTRQFCQVTPAASLELFFNSIVFFLIFSSFTKTKMKIICESSTALFTQFNSLSTGVKTIICRRQHNLTNKKSPQLPWKQFSKATIIIVLATPSGHVIWEDQVDKINTKLAQKMV